MTTENLQELINLCDEAMEHCRQCESGRRYGECPTKPNILSREQREEAVHDAYIKIQLVRMHLQEQNWKQTHEMIP